MTPSEQKEFVQGLSVTVANDICEQIDRGLVPDTWDGMELRLLLEYRHGLSSHMANRMGSKRKREYNRIVNVNNL